MNPADKFVLLTERGGYFVEYLIGELVLADSISEAMVFDDQGMASRFKKMLLENFNLACSINTFIPN